jgi:hypothetical protein
MASKLTNWINSKLKAKGKSAKEAQKDAGKYSSIAAAKRAGSLYYTNKKGKVMIAAYAEDLKAPIKTTPPKKRPEKKVPVIKAEKGPLKVKPTKEELLKDMEKNIEVQRKKREELEGVGRKKAGDALKDVDLKKVLKSLNPIGTADAATVEILMVSEKPKSKSKVDSSAKDQAALDKALRMDNKTEEERDARRSRNKVEIVDGKRKVTKRKKDTRTRIEREADLLEQERKKNYKRGKATKRAKGGLIDMRKTGLFR